MFSAPAAASSSAFCNVNNNGNANTNNANNANGVSWGFPPVWLLLADGVTQAGETRSRGREGAQDLPDRVNIYFDASGRTLLAWYRLMVMRYFMPGLAMILMQPSNMNCEAGEHYDK